MAMRALKSASIAAEIRRALRDGGSAKHAKGVQWFFKEEIKSHGWYMADLRKLAVNYRREILSQRGSALLLSVANKLFSGDVLEEKVFAVFLLEKQTEDFGDREFRLFERWLDRITSWADHDALVHYLISAMVANDPARVKCVFRWAKSRNRWHRRAACVALIRGARGRMCFLQISKLSDMLISDHDDMVQKGVGWLLRETAKADPKRTIPYLMRIRKNAPRLVLRTACETLPRAARTSILSLT